MTKSKRTVVIFGALVIAVSPLLFFGVWGVMSLNRWWVDSWDPSHPVPQSLITPQMREALNDVYNIDFPQSAKIIGVNYRGGQDYEIFSHFELTIPEWQSVQSGFGLSIQDLNSNQDLNSSQYLYSRQLDNECAYLRVVGWSVDPSRVEAMFRVNLGKVFNQESNDYTTVIQCYSVDGYVSLYLRRDDSLTPFHGSVRRVDWGF